MKNSFLKRILTALMATIMVVTSLAVVSVDYYVQAADRATYEYLDFSDDMEVQIAVEEAERIMAELMAIEASVNEIAFGDNFVPIVPHRGGFPEPPWEGDGNVFYPFLIQTIDDLVALSITENYESFGNSHFKLVNSISFDGFSIACYCDCDDTFGCDCDPFSLPTEYCECECECGEFVWTPIGSSGLPFRGVFDGGGYTIGGLRNTEATEFFGLFSRTHGATISNLILDVNIIGGEHSGALVGFAENTRIYNVYVAGSLAFESPRVGGIVGVLTGSQSEIYSSGFRGDITRSTSVVGGIAGLVSNNAGIVNSDVIGSEIHSSGAQTGGIAGIVNSGGSVINSQFNGTIRGAGTTGGIIGGTSDATRISRNRTNGQITGNSAVGGIAGFVGVTGPGIDIRSNLNRATVSGTWEVGGIMGSYFRSGGGVSTVFVVENANHGNVTARNNIAGGLAGQIFGHIRMTHSYNTGTIEAQGNRSGGLVGVFNNQNNTFAADIAYSYNAGVVSVGTGTPGALAGDNNSILRSNWMINFISTPVGSLIFNSGTVTGTRMLTPEQMVTLGGDIAPPFIEDVDENNLGFLNSGFPILNSIDYGDYRSSGGSIFYFPQLRYNHGVLVLNRLTQNVIPNATVNINGRDFPTNRYGIVWYNQVTGLTNVIVTAPGYRKNIQRYSLRIGEVRVVFMETAFDDNLPYITMVSDEFYYIDLRAQGRHFVQEEPTMLMLRVAGEWQGTPGDFVLFQRRASTNEPIEFIRPRRSVSSPDGFEFEFAPGMELVPGLPVYLQMRAANGRHSRAVPINLIVARYSSASAQFNNRFNKTNLSEIQILPGMDIATGGLEFAELFPIDLSMDLTFLPAQLYISRDSNGVETIRIVFGLFEAAGSRYLTGDNQKWKSFATNIRNANSPENRMRAFRDFRQYTKASPFKASVETYLRAVGYAEIEWDGNRIIDSSGALIINVYAGVKFGQTFIAPVIPIPVYYEIKVRIGLDQKLELTFYTYEGGFEFNPHFTVEIKLPKASVEAGIGIRRIATVGVRGTFTGELGFIPLTYTAKAEGYVVANVLFTGEARWNIGELGPWQLYPRSGQGGGRALSAAFDTSEMSLVSRGYTARTTAWQGTAISPLSRSGSNNLHTLQDWIMPDSLPQIAQVGNDLVILFLHDDSTRAIGNHTVLMYSRYNNGIWSSPLPVWESNTADMFFSHVVHNNELYVVWQKQNSTVTQSGVEGLLQELAQNSEIAFARFNRATGAFENQTFITNNDTLNMLATIAVSNNETAVLWVNNSASDPLGMSGTFSIYRSILSGGNFSTPSRLYETNIFINELEAGYINGQLSIAFITEDINGNLTAYSLDAAGNAMPFSGGISARALQFNEGRFYWTSGGFVHTFNPVTRESFTLNVSGYQTIPSSSRLVRNENQNGIVWLDIDEGNYFVRASVYVGDGRWSLPITLVTTGTDAIQFMDVEWSNNRWNIVMSTLDMSTDRNSLVFASVEQRIDTALVNAFVNQWNEANGRQPVQLMVENLGDTVVNTLDIRIEGNGRNLLTQSLNYRIEPGELAFITVYVDVSTINTVTDATVTVSARNETDLSNNQAIIQLGQTDVSITLVQYIVDDHVIVEVRVSNNSRTPANASIVITEGSRDGAVVDTIDVGTVCNRYDMIYIHRINTRELDFGNDGSRVFFYRVDTVEPNHNQVTNTALIIVRPNEVPEIPNDLPLGNEREIIAVTGVRIQENTITLRLNDENMNTASPVASVIPANASNPEVRWEVEDPSIAFVNSFGEIRATGVGETRVFAITYDGGFTAYVRVIVTLVEPTPHQFTIMAGAGGSIAIGESGRLRYGEVISISATANSGYVFSHWTSSDGGAFANFNSTATTFRMPDNSTTVTAHFVPATVIGGNDFTPIRTAAELSAIRNNLDGNFRLMNDIDLAGVAWEPIGGWGAQFTGILDGNGHTIRNLNINLPTRDYVGLFGYSKGLIKDLALDNVNVNGQFIVGSLAGFNSGYIRNVTVTNAHISAFSIAGGLVGTNSLGNIYNAHVRNSPSITGGSACVGGIAAQNVDGVISHSSVTNIGEIRTTSIWGQVGGIVGTNTSRSTIEYSFTSGVTALGVNNFIVGGIAGIQNFATIRMSYSTNDVGGIVNADVMNAYWGLGLGMQHTGGLVGHMRFGTIEQSFATGNVSAVIGDSGGLVGMIVDSGTIRNSFSTGNVALTSNSAGFAGNIGTPMSGFEIRIENSYSLSDNPNGFATGGTITNSFFELDRINNPSTEAINSPQARTAEQMMMQSTFTGWNFDTIWIMESGGYPRLRGVGNQ